MAMTVWATVVLVAVPGLAAAGLTALVVYALRSTKRPRDGALTRSQD